MARKSSRALWTAHLKGGARVAPSTKPSSRTKKAVAKNSQRGVRGIILGIDPSLRGTGLAVIDSRTEPYQLLASTTVKLTPKYSAIECLGKIAEAVEGMTEKFKIDQAAIEETIYVQNFRTAQAMGASRGAALSILARLNIEVKEYAPKRIKLAVTGHGSASKEQVGKMIKSILNLRSELPLDESDAAAIALCHAFTARG
jgi:crossover junction endodeoxyribonuclease RuvC